MHKGFLGYSNGYTVYLDKDEIKNNYLIIDKDIDIDDLDKENKECVDCSENCINCYYSNGKYCSLKDIYINKYSPLCWGYRDCLTMQPASDFQYDGSDFDDFD